MKAVLLAVAAVVVLLIGLTSLAGAALVTVTSTGPAPAGGTDAPAGAVSSAGWVRPVPGRVGSGFRTADRPGHDGVDLITPRYTVVRAASAGTVVTVVCNAHRRDGTPYSCDRDGSPDVLGCGWYAELRHPSGVVTRYCHLVEHPAVHVGQTVSAGDPIGRVGTSGNSSGSHLHFETHTSYPADTANATDPAAFMAAHSVTL
ncbi:M23 family metallopeptidase [Cryptosporangium sp. NPDC048952]|uniref:M23 family metallopeptidase n=1 Tax=Cryptosporangium sp. NPDC048952 TaxID=3363961 RepID=UPI0037224114